MWLLRRDVKSSNILLTRDGAAKVGDVGLAMMTDYFSSASAATGTFAYAAPEILMGKPTTSKVRCWQMLHGAEVLPAAPGARSLLLKGMPEPGSMQPWFGRVRRKWHSRCKPRIYRAIASGSHKWSVSLRPLDSLTTPSGMLWSQ